MTADITLTTETPRAPTLGRPIVRPQEPAVVAQTAPKVLIKDVRFYYKGYEALKVAWGISFEELESFLAQSV